MVLLHVAGSVERLSSTWMVSMNLLFLEVGHVGSGEGSPVTWLTMPSAPLYLLNSSFSFRNYGNRLYMAQHSFQL